MHNYVLLVINYNFKILRVMEINEIKEKVFEIVATVCNVDKNEVTETSTVGDFPTWDSLGQLNILQTVQDEFEVEFEPEEMMDVEDVNDIIKIVQSKL